MDGAEIALALTFVVVTLTEPLPKVIAFAFVPPMDNDPEVIVSKLLV